MRERERAFDLSFICSECDSELPFLSLSGPHGLTMDEAERLGWRCRMVSFPYAYSKARTWLWTCPECHAAAQLRRAP